MRKGTRFPRSTVFTLSPAVIFVFNLKMRMRVLAGRPRGERSLQRRDFPEEPFGNDRKCDTDGAIVKESGAALPGSFLRGFSHPCSQIDTVSVKP